MLAKAVLVTGGSIYYPKLSADTTRNKKDKQFKIGTYTKKSSGKKNSVLSLLKSSVKQIYPQKIIPLPTQFHKKAFIE